MDLSDSLTYSKRETGRGWSTELCPAAHSFSYGSPENWPQAPVDLAQEDPGPETDSGQTATTYSTHQKFQVSSTKKEASSSLAMKDCTESQSHTVNFRRTLGEKHCVLSLVQLCSTQLL